MHPSQLSEHELLSQCEIRNDRRSGPGGQHRNKVETAVVAKHIPTGICGEASERRRQADNRRMAIHRLRLALAVRYRVADPPHVPSETWAQRVKNRKVAVSTEHDDFPSLLAEVLDQLARFEYQLPACATHFEVSTSQLVKLLRQHPAALFQVNAARQQRGLQRLT